MLHVFMAVREANLGDFKELLGNVDNTTELLHVLNASLDSIGVVGTSRVQNILVLLRLTLSPLPVHGATIFAESSEDTDQTECDDSFLVENVKLVADRGNRETGSGRQDGGLGDERVAGQGVNDGLGLLLGLLSGNVRGESRCREVGCDGREVAGDESRPDAGGAWYQKVSMHSIDLVCVGYDIPMALFAKREAIVVKVVWDLQC